MNNLRYVIIEQTLKHVIHVFHVRAIMDDVTLAIIWRQIEFVITWRTTYTVCASRRQPQEGEVTSRFFYFFLYFFFVFVSSCSGRNNLLRPSRYVSFLLITENFSSPRAGTTPHSGPIWRTHQRYLKVWRMTHPRPNFHVYLYQSVKNIACGL